MEPTYADTTQANVVDIRAGREPDVMCVHVLMTSAEVAALLKVSQATLCRWRATGTGPRVLWLSARVPRYAWADVERWMERSRS
jgi:predicted DNA-binding transcriptional regulator AlpA